MMDDERLARFSRQVLVPGVSFDGQEALAASRILLVGCGGLGNPTALYLAGSGVGHITLLDDDVIEPSNLPRQIVFTEADIGRGKAAVLAERLTAMNSQIEIVAEGCRFDEHTGPRCLASVDLVIDASDNMATRRLIDRLTAERGLPWFMGAAVQMEGQNIAFSPDRREGCYHCLTPDGASTAGSCAELGVLGPVVGAVAMQQVLDVIGFITGCSEVPWGRARIRSFGTGEEYNLALSPRADCRICGAA